MANQNMNKPKNLLTGLAIGALIGAAAALLTAPQSGERTRRMIRRRSLEIKDRTNDTIEDTIARAERALADLQKQMDDLSGNAKKKADELSQRGQKEIEKQRKRLEETRAKVRSG